MIETTDSVVACIDDGVIVVATTDDSVIVVACIDDDLIVVGIVVFLARGGNIIFEVCGSIGCFFSANLLVRISININRNNRKTIKMIDITIVLIRGLRSIGSGGGGLSNSS